MSGRTGSTPPKSGRFRKGQSGNPKGRPKAEPKATGSAFDVIIDQTLTVTQGGQLREVTIEEALQHQTYRDAIAGKHSAQREVMKMIEARERHVAGRQGQPAMKVEQRIERDDPQNADAALLILGIAARDPGRQGPRFDGEQLLLEPWAVQAALSRRRGGAKLTRREIDAIRRCTRDAGSLRWPRGTGE
ncbi:MAG: DUF5681 domain-containing protein [Alphaproteobacteria bacterium]|nr:DUF5681 domain-containing protein [Alphaproteobacteria bacterium]MDX5368479.1 DUF5681 domain-containing protein [Alphaproteobacteria bacterium]